ncbi:MAG: hypothetical protein OJF55_001899 [Rhodanobacteraceae bacterium]|jgi:hypothetical protein|nr:MAG: hypothetical protein OJF55_001899 [Rhodanobacteraceae bacterium]
MDALTPDLALTGVPRGGTTLACRLLGEAQDTVALFEPMAVDRLPHDPDAACTEVAGYFRAVRARIRRERRAPSRLHAGKLPDNPFAARSTDARRAWQAELGDMIVDKPLTDHFHLVIKHNAAFLALLPQLTQRMPVIGVLRNPLAVLCSWHSVDLPVAQGRLPAGERLDPGLARCLANEPDVLARQLHILDWCFGRLLRWLPPECLLRYEDIVTNGGVNLCAAAGVQGEPVVLHNRNAEPQCERDRITVLADALCRHAGPCVDAYGRASVATLAKDMLEDLSDG